MNIHPTAIIHPGAKLAEDVVVGPYAIIEDNVKIGRGTKIGSHSVIKSFVEIGEDNEIYQFASLGEVPQDYKFSGEESLLIIGDRNRIREFSTLNRGTKGGGGATRIGNDCFILSYVHLAHDCQIGNNVLLVNCVQMGGHVHIDDYAVVGGLVAIHQYVRIGTSSMIGGGSAVPQDVPPYMNVTGNRATLHGLNLVGLKRRGFSEEAISSIKKAYRILFRAGLRIDEAKARLAEEALMTPEVSHLVEFIEGSERGITR